MNLRMIKNDIQRSKLVTIGTTFFVMVAATLVVLVASLSVSLFGSVDNLMETAKTPHFMQMHTGGYDAAALESFANTHDNVETYQVLEFLNIEGAQIVIGNYSLQGSVIDNGFSVQSPQFDYLLDTNNQIIYPKSGEVYVPLSLLKSGSAQVGDMLTVGENNFVVAGFLRDSQMNSSLAGSQRFLVSEEDYAKLKELGNVEYLIEFRLYDLAETGIFETDYANANLASNGPALTYAQFRVVNALSDGIMIAVILLIAILVVAITFLCIRFTLLAKIEDDYREIGVMKAIGMRVSDIKKIYLSKYVLIAAIGSILGFGVSYILRAPLLENVRIYMGGSNHAGQTLLFGVAGVFIVFCVMVGYVNKVLSQFKKIPAAEAIRFGTVQEKRKDKKTPSLEKMRTKNINVALGVRSVLGSKKLHVPVLVVLVLCVFIFLLPLQLHSTVSSSQFVRYLGIGETDMLIGIQQTEEIESKIAEVGNALSVDEDVADFAVLTTKTFAIQKADGSLENLRVELGDHSKFPVEYYAGTLPLRENEIALSSLNAEELGLQVGDEIIIVTSQGRQTMTVCGIYSDISNGGKTAKAIFTDDGTDVMWCSIYVTLNDDSLVNAKSEEYIQRFSFCKVADIAEYVDQTFGSTVQAIRNVSVIACVLAPFVAFLITLLFTKMMIAKERYAIAVLKATGFTTKDIQKQFFVRTIILLGLGLVTGVLLVSTLGEGLAGLLISLVGVTSFQMEMNPLATWLVCPLAIAIAMLLATIVAIAPIKKMKISEQIKEV